MERGLAAGVRLTLEGSHALRLVGLQDGDEVFAVNGRPLGIAAGDVAGAEDRCVWWVRRGAAVRVIVAQRDPIDTEAPILRVDDDGIHHVARWAVARALSDPARRRPLSDHPSARATSGGLHPHLRDVLDVLGIPFGVSVVSAGDRTVATAEDLEAAATDLLTTDQVTWRLDGPTEQVRIAPVGPPIPLAPVEVVPARPPVVPVGRRVAPDTVEVVRSRIAGSLASPVGLAAVTPVQTPDGTGLQLTGIGPGSPLDQIGLVDGDVIERVNGITTDRLDKGSAVLQSFRVLDAWIAEGSREGRPRTWSVAVVDALEPLPLEVQRRARIEAGREALARWQARVDDALVWDLIPQVEPGGIATHFVAASAPPAGLQPFDVVLRVGGVRPRGLATLADAVDACEGAGGCTVQIVRAGERHAVTVSP